MAKEEDGLTSEKKLERGVLRTLFNWMVILGALSLISAWVYLRGWYQLEPGESAVILRLGAIDRIVPDAGLHFLLPSPLEHVKAVSVRETRHLGFGRSGAHGDDGAAIAMQTADSNIVNLSYELQYEILDAYSFLYGVAQPRDVLVAATQSAVREVVGRRTVDQVLSTNRGEVEKEAKEILQKTLDAYFAGTGFESAFHIISIELQDVQPPDQVAQAFADVTAAQQDEDRSLALAQGDAREIRESSLGKSKEYAELALAYKEAKILEATGAAARFEALLEEYLQAPDVTKRRLYLETMEAILPGVEKMIVEPDTVNMMPFLPALQRSAPAPAVEPKPAVNSSGRELDR